MLSPEMRRFYFQSVSEFKNNPPAKDMRENLERSAGLVKVAAGSRPLDDEMFQGCMAHLCYAATKFDANRGIEWSTFATRCAKRWFIHRWREKYRRVRTVNGIKSKFRGEVDDVQKFLPDKEPGPEERTELKDVLSTMLSHVDDLPQQQKEVIYARYGLRGGSPMTLIDAGKMQGVSKERARQIERRALLNLRRMMEESLNELLD